MCAYGNRDAKDAVLFALDFPAYRYLKLSEETGIRHFFPAVALSFRVPVSIGGLSNRREYSTCI